jgi:nucleoside-diphosphate-sugar epimerase
MKHLIIGCGYLGSQVARLRQQILTPGETIHAITRDPARADQLKRTGIEPILADVTARDSLVATSQPWESVLYAVGMDRRTRRTYEQVYVDGLTNLLALIGPVKHFCYISSTSVYGQNDGSHVDEASPAESTEENGQAIREAERRVQAFTPHHAILRFSGIYGPGRVMRQQSLMLGEPIVGDDQKWLNLIHVEDGARAALAAQQKQATGLFCISDGQPVRRRDFYTHLAELLDAPTARFQPADPNIPISQFERGNRQVRNDHAQQVLDWSPNFEDYKAGLKQALGKI